MSKAAILPVYHPITFEEVSDHYLKTKKFKVLGATFIAFLFSLWIVSEFSGSRLNIHILRYHNKHNEAAMAAVSVLGEGGEEGIHGLEVENHGRVGPNGHNHGLHEINFSSLSQEDERPNIAKQRFREAIKNDFEDFNYDPEPLTKVELEIDDLIHENPVVIFSKSYCSYSQRAKHILSLYNIIPSVLTIEVDKRDDADEFKQALMKITYRNTFPNVFIDGRSIGGSEETAIMHSNGRLKEILVEAGVVENNFESPNHDVSL